MSPHRHQTPPHTHTPPLPPCIQTDTRPHRSTYTHCRHLSRHASPLLHAHHQSLHIRSQREAAAPGRLKFRRRAIKTGIYTHNMQLFVSECVTVKTFAIEMEASAHAMFFFPSRTDSHIAFPRETNFEAGSSL